MKQELKLILDKPSVDTALRSMAKTIYDIGYPLAIVAILKGGVYTAYELLKCLSDVHMGDWPPDIVIGHIGLESYGEAMKSQGEVKLMTPLDLTRRDIHGRNVIIVDDCIETGNTLEEAKKIISGYDSNLLCTAVLVDKAALRIQTSAPKPDICGWSYLSKGFLVGCGMGAGERYRGIPEIYEMTEDKK